ncbi:unnamed protein product [Rotaria socialis]|uniref:Uncharacterized protein n=1 Tax=Rotaria socialis TaxID=392032 RepID=A0A821DTR1_9BILA|nr:unnamed protein product [Rotaria socialis]CAF4625176.1 unnamed protein product [Rotaria socialis]
MKALVVGRWIKERAVQLNLFENEGTRLDVFNLRTALISTRVYIVLLTFAVAILVLYTALYGNTQNITIQNPSQMTYEILFNKYPTTLLCRCSQVTIPYGKFISVFTRYHPICSSFFVSQTWINMLFNPNISYYIQIDFRSSASGLFQLLSSYCSFVNRSVNDALDDFLSNSLLSMYVLSSQSLDIQIQEESLFVQTSTANSIRRLIRLIRNTTYSNHLQPALQTSSMAALYFFPDGQIASGVLDGSYIQTDGLQCWCSVSSNCSTVVAFFDLYAYDTGGVYISPTLPIANLSGFVVGCYAIESLLRSTLECFFDKTCLDTLDRFFPITSITNFDVLSANQTRFPRQTSIETLINELFIEEWSTVISFSSYYQQCAPMSCTYMYVQHNNVLYILTTLLGLYGGLTVALRLCVLYFIDFWRRRSIRSADTNTIVPPIERVRVAWRRAQINTLQLNLFNTDKTRTDALELRVGVISTRIYIILLCLLATVLTIFNGLRTQLQNVSIQNPSQRIFEDLQKSYPITLQCPCSEIAISFDSFLSLSPTYHPVCSSPYVSFDWINSIEGTVNLNFSYSYTDFHMVGEAFFSSIATLCSLAQSTISDNLYIFNQTTLITGSAVSYAELMAHADAALNQFKLNTLAEFRRALLLIQIHTDAMFSTARGNADLYTYQLVSNITQADRIDFHSVPTMYGNCSCALNDYCQQQVYMYSNGNESTYEIKFPIPNVFIGCFVTQSVLQSTLECFFNKTCLNAVQAEISSAQSINASVLDSNLARFSSEMLIGTLINALMVDRWAQTIQYSQYYVQCAPELCTYTFTARNNALYILTTVIGLIGGLKVTLKVIGSLVYGLILYQMQPRITTNNRAGKFY